MHPFSKNLLVLMLLILMFGEEHRSVDGLEKCHMCTGNHAGLQGPDCDEDHTGKSVDCMTACAMIKRGDIITKRCEADIAIWKDPDGTFKCIKDKECYCNEDNCNKPKDFGRSGRDDSDTTSNASGWRKDFVPATFILSWIMISVALVAC
ncbi:hypothetical protein Ocin01_08155 [Orchesella cincta]|uniref:Uncharacterized protein n=1 Tax=Orchesella cincta TaxID=48709 RepID=A0A1D2MZQ0_ORCCI|nr:hypothetical protein Ocin01_08155 [Orchesella cincta]